MNPLTQKPLLQAQNICKAFSGVTVLDNVCFDVYPGKVNAIVGENGAGKSTLMKIISGVYQDYEGKLILNGNEIQFANPRQAQDKGIAIIHQELNLIPWMSVAENIWLGREFLTRYGLINWKKLAVETKKLLQKLELDIDPFTRTNELRVGQQQIVEIAKALSLNAHIIIMDEPTSAISEYEVMVLFNLIRSLTEIAVAVVYITHKLNELFEIADNITALRDGKFVGTADIADVTHDDIVQMMVGRDIQIKNVARESSRIGKPLLRIEGLCLEHPTLPQAYVVDHVDLELHCGEILGIFGLMGAGRTELLETLFGMHNKKSCGKIFIKNNETTFDAPDKAIKAGLGFVPEDRQLQGLVIQMSVAENISLSNLKKIERLSLLNAGLEKKLAEQYIKQLQIQTDSTQQIVETLSGGNQQKVVITKWLATNSDILLLDEPTRGIDVNAKNEIYKLIQQLAESEMGIIIVSSELPEILSISDRIIVLSEGRKTGEFTRQEATEEILMKAAISQ